MSTETVVRCPTCTKKYKVPTAMIGREVTCQKCMGKFAATATEGNSHQLPIDPPPAGHKAKKPFPGYELFLEEPSEQWFALLVVFGLMGLVIGGILSSEGPNETRLTAWGFVAYASVWLILAILLRINATIKSQCRLIRAELKDLPKNETAPVEKTEALPLPSWTKL